MSRGQLGRSEATDVVSATRSDPYLSLTVVILGMAAVAALFIAYLLAHRGAAWGALVLAVPAVAFWITRRRGNGLVLAVAVLLAIPYWYPHVWLIAPTVAVVGLLAGVAKNRLRALDIAFFLLSAWMALSWLFHQGTGITLRMFVQGTLPLTFYLWARLAVTNRSFLRLQWVMLLAAGVAACTVLYEAVRGTPVFVDPAVYQWVSSSSSVFRAGGVFGGSPTAATVLAMMLLGSAGLRRTRPRLVLCVWSLLILAIAATLDRAGLLGLLAGAALIAVVLPYRRWGHVAMVLLALAIPVYAVTTSSDTLDRLSTTKLISEGVIRSNTLSERATLLSLTLPLISIRATFCSGGVSMPLRPNVHSPFKRGAACSTRAWPRPLSYSPAEVLMTDYLRAMLEQGILGLVLVLTWLGEA